VSLAFASLEPTFPPAFGVVPPAVASPPTEHPDSAINTAKAAGTRSVRDRFDRVEDMVEGVSVRQRSVSAGTAPYAPPCECIGDRSPISHRAVTRHRCARPRVVAARPCPVIDDRYQGPVNSGCGCPAEERPLGHKRQVRRHPASASARDPQLRANGQCKQIRVSEASERNAMLAP
jgi:hypothetical protein